MCSAKDKLAALRPDIESIEGRIKKDGANETMEWVKTFEDKVANVPGSYEVARLVTKARRSLRGDSPDTVEAVLYMNQAVAQLIEEMAWLEQASEALLPELLVLDAALADNIGVRQQPKLGESLALSIAACQSHHRDVSVFLCVRDSVIEYCAANACKNRLITFLLLVYCFFAS